MNGKTLEIPQTHSRILEGGQDAFQHRIAPYRAELQLHCYRMLGSFQEAEDLVQETLLRAWRGLDRFEGRSSLRAWLYRIATNVCLKALAGRARRVRPEDAGLPNLPLPIGGPATEAVWLEPYPDRALEGIPDLAPGPEARYEMRETVQLAFVAAIQYLPPRQRAVLLLCDVMGWSAAETAGLLETSVASVNSALQRARSGLQRRHKAGNPPGATTLDDGQRALVARYVDAWEQVDLDSIAAMLRDDVILSMPPWRQWYCGREAVHAFFAAVCTPENYGGFRLIPTSANGQPACAVYSRAPGSSEFRAHSLHLLTLQQDEIAVITSFLSPSLFASFGLPPLLNAQRP